MIIDFHTHAFPDALAEKTIPVLSKNSGLAPAGNGKISGTLLSMQNHGIDYSVICNIATNAKQTANVNRFAISLLEIPGIIPFGSVHPDSDYIEQLDILKDAGIRGIKMHPDYQQYFIDDTKVIPIYEEILKRDFVLIFHTGKDYGVGEPTRATPARCKALMPMFRGEKVVLAHMGGFAIWDEVLELLVDEDVYFDTAALVGVMEEPMYKELLRRHNQDKVLFATDFPWENPKDSLELLKRQVTDETQLAKILGENAKRLLNL
ncbi:MAG: amidohydrolase [Ruminococcaceae bacterium]|nr:amidohydrolase [Oscillospiraceae bacterium]